MADFTRRDLLKSGTALAAGSAFLSPFPLRAQIKTGDAPALKLEPEKGASLRVLRPSKFVQGDETLWMENTKKFADATGVKVRVDNESWEDLRPKTAVAANIGSGPDVVLAWNDDPFQYPDKLLDLNDLAEYLGKKYGGWYPAAEMLGKLKDRWIGMPIGASGGAMVYRKSWMEQAGFKEFPRDLDGFLGLCQGLKKINHPAGFALGNAVGDGNGWTHWLLWGHGSSLVDENNNVVVDNQNTIKALEYAKKLYETFIPGTSSWLDPSNNKAFLAGEIGLTSNGISIYYAAKNSKDEAVKAMAEDIHHINYPVGPAGQPTEAGTVVNTMIFKHTKYPNAAKEYLRFMFEQEQYVPWQQASIGYWSQPLAAYEDNPIWTADPKHEPFKYVIKKMLPYSYKGAPGYASAAALADFIVNNMFAQACMGQKSPKDAAAEAQKRAERYYKV